MVLLRPQRSMLALAVSALAALTLTPAPAAADTRSFANSAPITIPASGTSGPAGPYPSSVNVSGLPGPITDVNLTLHRVGHTEPDTVGVLLVSPSGDTVNAMSFNCGNDDIEDFTWILDQQAATPMPGDGSDCPEFVYRPSGSSSFSWTAPAPPGPHGRSLDDFNGENANGLWRLYVRDCCDGETGDIEGGFTLTITTGPYDMAIPGTGTSGTANCAAARRRPGAIVSFIASRSATVTYRVRRARPGRRVGRRCVAPRRTNRRARRCTRFVAVRGSFRRRAAAGRNRFRFTGRIRGRKLPAGRYRLRATPRSSRRSGATRTAGFRIVRR